MSREYYLHFVDIIYIDHITSYLAHNVRPIFQLDSFSEIDWCKMLKIYIYNFMSIIAFQVFDHQLLIVLFEMLLCSNGDKNYK